MGRGIRKIVAVVVATLVAASALVAAAPAAALSGSQFDPGNIISDERFFDAGAMDEAQVQAFLESRVPRCVGANGYPCLKDFRTATANRAAAGAGHCSAYAGAAEERASRVIVKAARACGINPQVLMVFLQKEQGLITSTSPTAYMYRSAMGYGCPDTAPCDAEFYGFFNQVYKAAWQLRQYTLNPTGWRYRIGPSTIQYHPNAACGASTVTIQNQATANLYIYTPYQPNAAALANLDGVGDGCSSYGNRNFWVHFNTWFGPTVRDPHAPVGNVDSTKLSPTTAYISGWAIDPDSSASVDIHVYMDGSHVTGSWGGSYPATGYRPDVGASYPGFGSAHGFDIALPTGGRDRTACLYAYNLGPGSHTLLRCIALPKPTGAPIGTIDSAVRNGMSVTLSGWAVDPDSTGSIDVHVWMNGEYPTGTWGGLAKADLQRRDVGSALRGYGDAHGYQLTLTIPVGTTDICVYGIGVDPGGNSKLACRVVSTASGPPVGNIDAVTTGFGTARLTGWAVDPDTASSIEVHAYVNGRWGGAHLAGGDRGDIARAFPGYGSAHGFDVQLNVPPGRSEVCIYGYNVKIGTNSTIGCKVVQIPTGSPVGNVESVTVAPGAISAAGWAIDPDVPDPVRIHAYVDGRWAGDRAADLVRDDVAAAYPAYGPRHGFAFTVPVAAGTHTICLYAINVAGGSSHGLNHCRTVTVP